MISIKNAADVVVAIEELSKSNEEADQTLRQAAKAVADWIEGVVPHGEELPRGYRVVTVRAGGNNGDTYFFANADGEYLNASGGYFVGDFSCPTPKPSLEACARLADDVRDGLLTEIRNWLSERLTERDEQAAMLETKTTETAQESD